MPKKKPTSNVFIYVSMCYISMHEYICICVCLYTYLLDVCIYIIVFPHIYIYKCEYMYIDVYLQTHTHRVIKQIFLKTTKSNFKFNSPKKRVYYSTSVWIKWNSKNLKLWTPTNFYMFSVLSDKQPWVLKASVSSSVN